jgi:hypothetical protein
VLPSEGTRLEVHESLLLRERDAEICPGAKGVEGDS